MSYKIEVFDEGRIILNTMNDDFDLAADLLASAEETIPLLDNGPSRIVMITDARLMKVSSLEEILLGGKLMNNERVRYSTHHPHLLKSLSVINSRVLQFAVKGLNSASFGHTDIPIYDSMEEAFNVARKLLYGEASSAS